MSKVWRKIEAKLVGIRRQRVQEILRSKGLWILEIEKRKIGKGIIVNSIVQFRGLKTINRKINTGTQWKRKDEKIWNE